jgi:hypothetical protein
MRYRIPSLLALFAAGLLGACAMFFPEAARTKNFLIKAGFHTVKPETSEQLGVFAQMPDGALEGGLINGTQTYSYKDRHEGVVYVGGDKEYQEYTRLLAEWKMTHPKTPGQTPGPHGTMPGQTIFGGDAFWLRGYQ